MKINSKGISLIAVIIVMLLAASLSIAVSSTISTTLSTSVANMQIQQAFYIAEAGLQRVIGKLKNESDFRADPTTVEEDFDTGSYSVAVSRDGSTYTITSTATVDDVTREVTQSAVVTSAVFDYVIFANSNDLLIDNNVAIVGDVYCNEDVEVANNASVTGGLIYADDVSGGGEYTEAEGPPDPIPEYPEFDTSWYDEQISTAEGEADDDLDLGGDTTHNLNGDTEYYEKVTVQSSATLVGPGTIVATDDVELKNFGTITENVTIITKKSVKMQNNGEVASGTLVYAREDYTLQNDAILEAGNILAPTSGKKITLQNNSQMRGMIFASLMELKNYADVTGCVISDEYDGDKIQNNVTVTYDESVLGGIPTGMEAGPATVRLEDDWDENY